ncbi:tetratricopeptide repeat protein [Macrococcus armenti]|uniref:tetratricopeptide repeat protein n=1 Tax=Macrococcus armenti TaxID=2875764 RepID=UPI001CCC5BF2|nr:tetratricopeptide repeat protein [Macrococcus armenti]UBH22422.1 tetratricopeptide repeat protein [Macrococcus armenti]
MKYPTYFINPYTLREVLHDKDYTEYWCSRNEHNPEVVSFLRMLGQYNHAIELGLLFIDSSKDERHKATAIIRLASVYHWCNNFDKSKALFEECISINDDIVINGFAYQHLSKLYFDNKDYVNALKYAQKAYKIREKYDKKRLPSTELILKRLTENL